MRHKSLVDNITQIRERIAMINRRGGELTEVDFQDLELLQSALKSACEELLFAQDNDSRERNTFHMPNGDTIHN